MKKHILVIVVFFIGKLYAQQEVLELPVNYKSTFFDKKESLAISNEDTGDLVLYIEDARQSKLYLLNPNFETIGQLSIESLPNAFKEFIGHQIHKDGSYSMLFTNTSKKKYGELHIDFAKETAVVNELDFKFKKEAYVESFSHKGVFYLISAMKYSNEVNFYTFEKQTFSKSKTFTFDFLESKSPSGYLKTSYQHLVTKGIGSSGSLIKMDNTAPNAIEITSKPNKLYIIEDELVFTFDHKKSKTTIAKIKLPEFHLDTLTFKMPKLEKEGFVNHNSYLYEDKLFQIKVASSEMKFTIRDFKSNSLLKEIALSKDEDSITFKNTPIIQEGPGFIAGTRTREMEATSKFLRKISRGDVGISAYKQNENYKVVLGSKIEIKRGGGGFGGLPVGGLPIGAIGGAVSISFNPTFYAYGGYSSTKSTHIDCLFNNDFEHVEGVILDNVFDKIEAFEEAFEERSATKPEESTTEDDIYEARTSRYRNLVKLKNVFTHHNKIYFGFIGAQDKKYHLVRFDD